MFHRKGKIKMNTFLHSLGTLQKGFVCKMRPSVTKSKHDTKRKRINRKTNRQDPVWGSVENVVTACNRTHWQERHVYYSRQAGSTSCTASEWDDSPDQLLYRSAGRSVGVNELQHPNIILNPCKYFLQDRIKVQYPVLALLWMNMALECPLQSV